jgi:Protein of unknown function (DUF3102)
MSAILANISAELSRFDDQAKEANLLHETMTGFAQKTVQYAIRLGEILCGVKDSLEHGQWLPWVQENLAFSERTAQNYMAVFNRREDIKSESVADLGSAYKIISCHSSSNGSPTPRHRIHLTSDTPPTNKEIDDAFYDSWPEVFDMYLSRFPETRHPRVVQLITEWLDKKMYPPEATLTRMVKR